MSFKTTNNIRVSVICLAYNHEKYIRHTLEGFVNQKTKFKYEVLINDDASTDGTADIIREYESKYPDLIKPVYQTINQYTHGGKIIQRFLYPKAQGKYFAWCEGDDYWCDEYKLQKQFDIMEAHPECSICTHKVQCINEDGTLNDRVIPENSYDLGGGCISDYDIADALWQKGGYPFQTSSYFVRRNALFGYIDGTAPYLGYYNGDQAIIRTALANGHFWYINESMSSYRRMSEGSWSVRFRTNFTDEERIRHNIKKIYGDISFDEYTDGRFHEWIFDNIARKAVSIGIYDKNEMQQIIDEAGISKRNVFRKCSSFRLKIKFLISQISPKLYNFLRKTKHMIMKK